MPVGTANQIVPQKKMQLAYYGAINSANRINQKREQQIKEINGFARLLNRLIISAQQFNKQYRGSCQKNSQSFFKFYIDIVSE